MRKEWQHDQPNYEKPYLGGRIVHLGGTLIDPKNDIKRNCNWKAKNKALKKLKQLSRGV